jgi:hypothetical protein
VPLHVLDLPVAVEDDLLALLQLEFHLVDEPLDLGLLPEDELALLHLDEVELVLVLQLPLQALDFLLHLPPVLLLRLQTVPQLLMALLEPLQPQELIRLELELDLHLHALPQDLIHVHVRNPA